MRQLQQRGTEDSYELLTAREREVLQLLAEGNQTKRSPPRFTSACILSKLIAATFLKSSISMALPS